MSNLSFYLQSGYNLVSETKDSYIVCKKQSILIHLLLFFTTGGIGNIVYFFVKNNQKLHIEKENNNRK